MNLTELRNLKLSTFMRSFLTKTSAAQVRTLLNVEDGATNDLTAAEILALLLTVDGAGSGLDADTLDASGVLLDKAMVLPRSGAFYTTGLTGSTSGALGASTARAVPFYFPRSCTIDQLGVDVSATGTSGALFRVGIWNDDGTFAPGTVKHDAGTVDCGSTTGPQMVTGLSIAITPGVYWFGGALQGTLTSQPTLRTVSVPQFLVGAGSAANTAGVNTVGASMGSVTGALPTWTTFGPTTAAPRVIFRVA